MSGKTNVSVCSGHELANALYSGFQATNGMLVMRKLMPVLSKQQLPIELLVHSSAEHPPTALQFHPQRPASTNVYPKQPPPTASTLRDAVHLLLTCTCVGIHPGRVEPASPMALTTSRTEAFQARRSCASSNRRHSFKQF